MEERNLASRCSVQRDLKMQAQQDSGVVGATAPAAHPLHAMVLNMASEHFTEAGSLFECKGGLRLCLLAPRNATDPAEELGRNPIHQEGAEGLGVGGAGL